MEAVHKTSKFNWIDATKINIRDFLTDWKDALSFPEPGSSCMELKSLLSKEEYKSVEEQCGLAAMRCDYQERVEPTDNLVIPDGVNLKTLENHAVDLKQSAEDKNYASVRKKGHTKYPPNKILNLDPRSYAFTPVVTPDVILSVQIYKPQKYIDQKVIARPKEQNHFSIEQEFLVLGCQTLTELRDKIDCISDKVIPGECSDSPFAVPSVTCKDIYKSGFFYINGVFYNDMRDKDCKDYSVPIMEWTKDGKRGIGPFTKARMEETTFLDLTIQLGYPYVYTHQGDCEHLLVFSDLQL